MGVERGDWGESLLVADGKWWRVCGALVEEYKLEEISKEGEIYKSEGKIKVEGNIEV